MYTVHAVLISVINSTVYMYSNHTYFHALWVFLELQNVFLPQLPLSFLAVGDLVVPFRGVLSCQVFVPHFVQRL